MEGAGDIFSFDGNWFDIASFAGGVVYAGINHFRSKTPKAIFCLATGLDFLNGLSIVPLLFLVGSLASTHMLSALVHFNRVLIAGAGLVALFAILEAP